MFSNELLTIFLNYMNNIINQFMHYYYLFILSIIVFIV
jgi:hypothetical protein